RDWGGRVVPYEQVLRMSTTPNTNSYLIDVREPEETAQGMIPSAVNIPLTVLGNSLHMSREMFGKKYGFEKPHTYQEIVFYCRSGRRAATACDVATRNGFIRQVPAYYQGSWLEWVSRQ
ncbi:Rhodanese-like protein, partial [Fistulina hepatica ATCC 64428]